MKEENYNERELRALEEEIRSMGIPYSSNEPDERYFANFRVRLMDRIEAKEKKHGALSGAWEWLVSSPLRYLSLGATLAAVIAAVLLTVPAPETRVATVQPIPPKIEASVPVRPTEIKPDIAAIPKVVRAETKSVQNPALAVKPQRGTVADAANRAADFASIDATLSNAESDDPVNLENLSESELESVITIAQEIK